MTPKIHAVIETAIYVDDLAAAEDFYTNILGLPVIGKEQSRHVFFQVDESNVLLAFLPETTLKGNVLPSHGATGPGVAHLPFEFGARQSQNRHSLP